MHVHLYDVRMSSGANAEAGGSGSKANLIGSFSGHASWVLSVAQNPISKVFASGSSDRKVKLSLLGVCIAVVFYSLHLSRYGI